MVNHGGNRYRVTLCVYINWRGHTDLQVMEIRPTTQPAQPSWRQAAEERYEKLMESTQRENRRRVSGNAELMLYIAKSGKVQVEDGRTRPNNINFLV